MFDCQSFQIEANLHLSGVSYPRKGLGDWGLVDGGTLK